MRRNKNKYGYNFPFQVLPFNQPKNIPIGSTLIEYGSLKLKIVRVFIFVTPPLCKKKFLRFDPTLGSNNSGLKNYRIKNHHIFGIAWTSAFIWHIWIPLKKFCIGVIGQNAKRTHFLPFSVSAPRNNVGGRRSDNFEGTGRAHSSF